MLTRVDLIIRKHILNLMCQYETKWTEEELDAFGLDLNFNLLEDLHNDGLIEIDGKGLKATS